MSEAAQRIIEATLEAEKEFIDDLLSKNKRLQKCLFTDKVTSAQAARMREARERRQQRVDAKKTEARIRAMFSK